MSNGVSHFGLVQLFDIGDQVAHLSYLELGAFLLLGVERAQFFDNESVSSCHHHNFLTHLQAPLLYLDQNHNSPVRVIPGVKEQGL